MGDKMERVTFRVDSELKDQLNSDENLNTSGLLRSLLESYLMSGDAIEVGLERRLKDRESELERLQLQKARLEHDIEKKQREIERVEQRIEERRQSIPEEVFDFVEMVVEDGFPRDELHPDNLGVQRQAKNAGLSPRQFVRSVEEQLEGDSDA